MEGLIGKRNADLQNCNMTWKLKCQKTIIAEIKRWIWDVTWLYKKVTEAYLVKDKLAIELRATGDIKLIDVS